MKIASTFRSLLPLPLLALGAAQAADSFSLDWFSIDGGGGTARGAAFELSATIGQPDAAVMQGGPFTLNAGFWPGPAPKVVAVQPVLSAGRIGDVLVLAWPAASGAFALERSGDLSDPSAWQGVPVQPQPVGPELQVTLPRGTATAFFRLRAIANP